MKKIVLLAAVLMMSASAAFAQTESGTFRIGGSSNLGFSSIKQDVDGAKSANEFNLGVDAGYFLIDNLSLNVGVNFESYKMDEAKSNTIGINAGLRYYLPVNVFVNADFELRSLKNGDDKAVSGTALNLGAGYAAFVCDNFAIEPMVGYRLGLGNKDDGTKASGFVAKVGLSYYF